MRAKIEALRARRDSDLRARARGGRREERPRRTAQVHHRPRAGDPRGARGLHRGGHAAAARRARRPLLRPPGRGVDRRQPERLQGHRHQVDRAGRHRADGRARGARALGRQAGVRRGLEPRVPARRLGDRGLPASRPRGHRRAHAARHRRHARHLRPAQGRRRAVRGRQRRVGRDDQVRLQRLSGHQDHLHQRGRRDLRGGGRRSRRGRPRHGPRQPDRPEVPPSGPRLRRLLLPQGHPGGGPDRRGARPALRDHRGRAVGQRARQAPHDRQDRDRPSGRSPARPSPCSAWPSRATPTTCASRRRSRSSRASSNAARRSAPSTPRR